MSKTETNNTRKKSKKQEYKVNNWSDYNKSLKKRGKISLYFPKADIKSQFINEESYKKGVSGRSETYKKAYVEFLYMMYRVFGLGLRQITGYIEDLFSTSGLNLPVPSFGHLSDLFSSVTIEVKNFCKKLNSKIQSGEQIELIADSTGLRFGKASYWYETKYNKPCNKKPWKKLHISIDKLFNIHGCEITDHNVSDIEVSDKLIPAGINLSKFTADGAYYSIAKVEDMARSGIMPCIPPPANAVVHNKPTTIYHDQFVQYIKDEGRYAFIKKYKYDERALVECQNYRIKKCIGNSLLTQKEESQKNEGKVIANIINLWNSFGRCNSVKLG